MDVLAVGNYVLYKEQQDEELKENYEERFISQLFFINFELAGL